MTTDILFPIHQQRELADGISAVCEDTTFVELDRIRGHDSFLVDMDAFRPVICDSSSVASSATDPTDLEAPADLQPCGIEFRVSPAPPTSRME